ncbi:hypothetical protein BDA99DRAFT_534073 [Phascolomyces articulosus]|uniref:Uncharacterized protein n=1 Tax=Phascolomyces articulosus TaxID=60185 RepID=A0AAD5PHA3_9FUNG|nr:hypothetical protein BDA99DRAFT_534073 [Phascolomyces articulosus]
MSIFNELQNLSTEIDSIVEEQSSLRQLLPDNQAANAVELPATNPPMGSQTIIPKPEPRFINGKKEYKIKKKDILDLLDPNDLVPTLGLKFKTHHMPDQARETFHGRKKQVLKPPTEDNTFSQDMNFFDSSNGGLRRQFCYEKCVEDLNLMNASQSHDETSVYDMSDNSREEKVLSVPSPTQTLQHGSAQTTTIYGKTYRVQGMTVQRGRGRGKGRPARSTALVTLPRRSARNPNP